MSSRDSSSSSGTAWTRFGDRIECVADGESDLLEGILGDEETGCVNERENTRGMQTTGYENGRKKVYCRC